MYGTLQTEEIAKLTRYLLHLWSDSTCVTLLKYLGNEETADRTANLLVQPQRVKKILLESLKLSCDESNRTDDDSVLHRKKRNINTRQFLELLWGTRYRKYLKRWGYGTEKCYCRWGWFYMKTVRPDRTTDSNSGGQQTQNSIRAWPNSQRFIYHLPVAVYIVRCYFQKQV